MRRSRTRSTRLLSTGLRRWTAGVLALLARPTEAATELVLQAGGGAPVTADVHLTESAPGKVPGDGRHRDLSVKHDPEGKDNRVALLGFPGLFAPGALPPGAVVQGATLRLWCRDGGRDQDAHLVTAPWKESEATWAWFMAADGKGARVAGVSPMIGQRYYEMDVREAVRAWAADPARAFGLALVSNGRGEGKGADPVIYASGEDPDEQRRPRLTIAYDPPGTPLLATAPEKTRPAPTNRNPNPAPSESGRRVALVGDDWVARGAAVEDLAAVLGGSFAVRGFAQTGATVLRGSGAEYLESEAARALASFRPQVIAVLLGGSDTRPGLRDRLGEWEEAYKALVVSLQQFKGVESILICTPVLEAEDEAAGADAKLAAERLEVPLRLTSVYTGTTLVDTARAAQTPAESEGLALSPGEAAVLTLAEAIAGKRADARRLPRRETAAAPPGEMLKPQPQPTPPAPRAPAAPKTPTPRPLRVALAGDDPLPGGNLEVEVGRLLGKGVELRGFHAPGTHLLQEGSTGYTRLPLLAELLAYQPDLVLITLTPAAGRAPGSADWAGAERELRALLNQFATRTPRPRVALCAPLPPVGAEPNDRASAQRAEALERFGRAFRLPVLPAPAVIPAAKPEDPRALKAHAKACIDGFAAALKPHIPPQKETP